MSIFGRRHSYKQVGDNLELSQLNPNTRQQRTITTRNSNTMSLPLFVALGLLMVDGIIELGFITSMVRWLHVRAGGHFDVNYLGETFSLNGKPLGLLVDQGHASNGAAGTAFIVVGFGGLLALYLRHRQLKRTGGIHSFTAFMYNFWLTMTVLSAIYSLAAFVYVFVQTYQHDNQSINLDIASKLNNRPYPNNVPYPKLEWTPQNWFPAVLRLPLASDKDRSDIEFHLTIMRAWQWNLIPMMILGFVLMGLAFVDRMRHRQMVNKASGDARLEAARQKTGSPYS